MGVVPAVVFGGSMTIGIVVYNWIKNPTIKGLSY
jgi:hypothetical protein